MKNKKIVKLNLQKNTISKLQLSKVQGGVHTSCTPDCNITKTNVICLPKQENNIQ